MFIRKISFMIMVLVFSVITAQSTQAAKITFTDLSSSHPAYGEIMHLVELGVLEGSIENGKRYFKANEQITRGQAAKMVVVAMGQTPLVVQKSSFSDIDLKTNATLSGYIERAVQLGYMNEYAKGKFEPKIALSRNEMAVVLTKAFNLDVEKTANLALPFPDVAKSDPYYKYISAIYYNGITSGTLIGKDIKYSAKDPVTRAQFSSFAARAQSQKYRLKLPEQPAAPVAVVKPIEKEAIGKVFVAVDGLNIRSTAKSENQSNILGKVNAGKELPVFEDQGYWLKVAYNGQFAFVAKEYTKTEEQLQQEAEKPVEEKPVEQNPTEERTPAPVETETPTEQPALPIEAEKPAEQPTIEVPVMEAATIGIATVNNLNIREQNSASSNSLGKINRGTVVNVLSQNGYWVEVNYEGTIGYVDKRYLRLKNTTGTAVKDRIIVIDPGHGGKDPGAVSGQAVEKSIVFKVTQLVKQKLEADGAKVLLTRTGDTYPSLDDRTKFASANYGEMFISIHANAASSTSAKGTETFYSVTSNDNEKEDFVLASNINNQIVKNASMNNRGVKRADYVVVKGLTIPAVLVELGFVTNAEDRSKLIDDKYIEIFAQSIYNGIVEYYARN
ncbi:N-acetylmuramoyl-L-alanine amidase [Lysinibacillus sp. 2017]|uniref:N-acetylmuramoyl-L-alanine amidase n=1 Tax=unclassified Lysinibacillus TaxID=2636778 RepID=UPI000D526B4B|nr:MULTISPECIES: N-acetylmuramoyl-L-alanine amidase [unclassified Lysinibacillus]AWE06356.1 N-acetylmuramoyl-L-alanine amidase [Lysinibacillus sp. 2017]TGN31166.1 N-acetylmuramoyl-L-alanine amidase [Lysinibacillus sp. S2017]